MKRYSYSILILCLALTTVAFPQDKTDKTKAAEQAAADWLKFMDFDAYARGWRQASLTLKAVVSEGNFEQTLRATRTPLGVVRSRQLKSVEYKKQMPRLPEGQYALIRYNTSFEHKKVAIETVLLELEKDGHWRAAGYSID
jgi:hypothetical protein